MVVADLIDQNTQGGIYSSDREFLPLRIFSKASGPYLCSPYELCEDRSSLRILEGERTAHLELISIPESFRRHMFFSHAQSSTPITASGYLFEGPVKVSAWKVHKNAVIDPSEGEGIGLLKNIEIFQVK